jgi:hypothetical protein
VRFEAEGGAIDHNLKPEAGNTAQSGAGDCSAAGSRSIWNRATQRSGARAEQSKMRTKQSAGKKEKKEDSRKGSLITHTYTWFNYIFGPPKFQIANTLPLHLKSNFYNAY